MAEVLFQFNKGIQKEELKMDDEDSTKCPILDARCNAFMRSVRQKIVNDMNVRSKICKLLRIARIHS